MTLYCIDIQSQNRSCGTDGLHYELLNTDSTYQKNRWAIESHVKKYQSQIHFRSVKIRIPVVVHVVYNTDIQNISDSMIYSQIDALNRDFGQLLSTKYANATASNIEFVLATSDPVGYGTNGITRTKTDKINFPTGMPIMMTDLGGKDPWPLDQYLNIWVGNVNSVLGFAYMPGTMSDGVVINYRYFGQTHRGTFGMGRTATHEVGHWLNLFHIWGLNTGCEADDEVEDTPNSESPNFGCKVDHTSCGGTDMVENFMDYSDDACMNLFTRGQIDRMESLFAPGGYRHKIINSPGLLPGKINPCSNGIQDQGEEGIDCGGSCTSCPTCTDGIKNGNETDVDCGGNCKPCHCLSLGLHSDKDFIEAIQINDSIKNTGNNNGYHFEYHTFFTLYSNYKNEIKCTPNTSGLASERHWAIWIDWDKDGYYTLKNELIYKGFSISNLKDSLLFTKNFDPSYLNDSFTIRIQMQWGEEIKNGCDILEFGEVEDYKVIIREKAIDPCENGLQDANETGIDCGPFCKPCILNYCTSKSQFSSYEYIKRITWNHVPYFTGNNNGYRDFTSTAIQVSKNEKIEYKLEAGFAGEYTLPEYWQMLADWNKDGDFDDEGELITNTFSAIAVEGNFNIPIQVTGIVRLRIIMSDAFNTKSCGEYVFGETEDYALEIKDSENRLANKNPFSITVFPNPATDFINIGSDIEIKSVSIVNNLGQILRIENIEGYNHLLRCSNINNGIYYLIFTYADHSKSKQRIVISK